MIAFPNLKGYLSFTEMILKDTDLRFTEMIALHFRFQIKISKKNFTEMIAFPILKYNNHNTVTLCGNDCISYSEV